MAFDISQEYIARKVQYLLGRRELDSAALMRRLGRRIADLENENKKLRARTNVEMLAPYLGQRQPLSFAPVPDDDGA
jgi:hypothetical protein